MVKRPCGAFEARRGDVVPERDRSSTPVSGILKCRSFSLKCYTRMHMFFVEAQVQQSRDKTWEGLSVNRQVHHTNCYAIPNMVSVDLSPLFLVLPSPSRMVCDIWALLCSAAPLHLLRGSG